MGLLLFLLTTAVEFRGVATLGAEAQGCETLMENFDSNQDPVQLEFVVCGKSTNPDLWNKATGAITNELSYTCAPRHFPYLTKMHTFAGSSQMTYCSG